MVLIFPFTHGESLGSYSLLAGCLARYLELPYLSMSPYSLLTASRILVQGPESIQRARHWAY